jgi:predicted secreted Zn-dependent protease
MTRRALPVAALVLLALAAPAAARTEKKAPAPARSYAIYGEYGAGANKLMVPGLNRRVFNKVEAQAGRDIKLESDGAIALRPGTYRIAGYSITTMQTTFDIPAPRFGMNYPGYGLVYPVRWEKEEGTAPLEHALGIGTVQDALNATPSLFDLVYTTKTKTEIAVGHQSGEDLHDEVYLSVYSVAGIPSDYHVFARISITKL